MKNRPILPLGLHLDNKKVLVIGAGPVAGRRIDSLLAAGASVHVVSPQIPAPIQLLADTGKITLARRKFKEEDLNNTWLVFAHTGDPQINRHIAQMSRRRHIWCLTGGDANESDMWMMANTTVNQELTLAVSANANPHRAKKALAELADHARAHTL